MASISQTIQREINPFDSTTFRPGNFWQEQQNPVLNVESIHQEAISDIKTVLDQVASDHRTRTLMLYGDSGSGKSHLLGRLKRQLNSKAFFAYIGPWPDSDFIWRHILRQAVDSLLYAPEGQKESQLLLWLKGLPAFKDRGFVKWVLGERGIFIRNFRTSYPTGIYNAKEFFGVLYDLTNPELYPIACDWLRGDLLDEDDLKALGVRSAIDTEDAAQKILANFGKISAETQPIVLCFDQLDNIPRLSNGFIDLQALFSVNSSIHNEHAKNFLVIISIITNTWKENAARVQSADKARLLDASVSLKPITLDEAEALWAARLYPLHQQADNQPPSSIYPLTRQALEEKFPRARTMPRAALMLGRQLYQEEKIKLINEMVDVSTPTQPDIPKPPVTIVEINSLAAFQLVWQKEFNQTQQKISRIGQLASQELIQMLREVLGALQLTEIQPRFLPSPTYANSSLSYQDLDKLKRVGIVWTEASNLTSFSYVMKACQKAENQNLCQVMYLIRAERLGTPNNQGYRRYETIFTGSLNRHIKPDLTSVHYLATYHNLVNAACSRELVVGDTTPNLDQLEDLIRKSEILNGCTLLQDLKIVFGTIIDTDPNPDLKAVKDFLLNFVITQQFMGRQTLTQNASSQFPQLKESEIEQVIQELCQENRIQIFNPGAKQEAQLICLVPKAS